MFLHTTYFYRFRYQRRDGYRLLLPTAVAATILLFVSRASLIGFVQLPIGLLAQEWWLAFAPFEYSGTTAGALLLGLTLPLALNTLRPEMQAKTAAIKHLQDEFLALVHDAAVNATPVYVTLESRKTYVGFVLSSPKFERPEKTSLVLLPLWSGHRDPDTLESVLDVFYNRVYDEPGVDPSDFAIAIPVARITSIQRFDVELYTQHFDKRVVEN